MRGFVLVLVVEESQAENNAEAIVRVCRDFDVATVEDLEVQVEAAAWSANNYMRRASRAVFGESPLVELARGEGISARGA